ncbi:hypothetical protein NPIL_249691, partial [Nephila pilipes]
MAPGSKRRTGKQRRSKQSPADGANRDQATGARGRQTAGTPDQTAPAKSAGRKQNSTDQAGRREEKHTAPNQARRAGQAA